MLSHIQSALRAHIADSAHRVGPFLARLDPDQQHPFFNYAIPDDGATPTADEVAALIAAFTTADRLPRLEYVGEVPAVDSALLAAGFAPADRLGLMIADSRPEVSPVPQITVSEAVTDQDWWAAARVQNLAYGAGPEVSAADVDRLRRTRAGGGVVAVARWSGQVAGSGLCTPPQGGLSEIAAIGVLEEFRRRGVASAVGGWLRDRVHEGGARPYLQTESANEHRLYGRLGFVTAGYLATWQR